ncbi:ABC transporter ATP-binding protein [Egicoccus halophilus]|uniref:ABC transporter ATP-binding protein n=1 Tax=Egicoccus halophilus TaxID=1670830 RepID=A0A8J3EVZ3_9ACTN|nr:ABC transporter ATP-binding protein [Egicoccus halophilus]GGI09185.1 ABC transporter ATP-binding protein [Egicoccus halophilus]
MSPVADPELVLVGVTRRFGEVVALDRLDLTIARGEVVGLLGHNGAGKTTTVRLLAGLLAADGGTVRVGGLDPTVDGATVRRRLGVLPADPVVDRRMTAAQNLAFAADVFGMAEAGLDARIDAALERFGLAGRGDDEVAGFSTGMRQRLSLARVLLPDPEVLLLDEPTAALDPIAARQVRRELAMLAAEEGRTVVVATHDLAEAELLCDRVVVLERGRIVVDGSPAELAAAHGTGGLLLEVAPDQVDIVHRRLSRLAAVRDVEIDAAGRVRARGVPRDEIPGLVWALAAAELAVYEVRRLDPTLEEVYLALHDRAPVRAEAPGTDDGGGG